MKFSQITYFFFNPEISDYQSEEVLLEDCKVSGQSVFI